MREWESGDMQAATAKIQTGIREWLPLADATKALGKSQTTIERLVAAEELRSKLEPRPGRKPERVYHAGDIERLVNNPTLSHATQQKTMALALPDTLSDSLRRLVDVIAQQAAERKAETDRKPESESKPSVSLSEKLWLTIEEAEYSGLPRGYLLRLIRKGQIVATKTPSWRIQRASLEEFSRSQLSKSLEAFEG
jgi:excisionase family DNA binding protein